MGGFYPMSISQNLYMHQPFSSPRGAELKITYLSHMYFELNNSKTILIDPFFEEKEYTLSYDGIPDVILVIHEHFDHGDTQRFDASVVFSPQCIEKYTSSFQQVGKKTEIENIPIEIVSASYHQSQYPLGYIVEMEDKRIYYMGEIYHDGVKSHEAVDIQLISMERRYTMNSEEASEVVRIINSPISIPIHYHTFPPIKADPDHLTIRTEQKRYSTRVLHFGQTTII
jgi:L-ascorbate metabolism protein UlaG (beta-lactamase superfamily)